jgi:hypothetical protein
VTSVDSKMRSGSGSRDWRASSRGGLRHPRTCFQPTILKVTINTPMFMKSGPKPKAKKQTFSVFRKLALYTSSVSKYQPCGLKFAARQCTTSTMMNQKNVGRLSDRSSTIFSPTTLE